MLLDIQTYGVFVFVFFLSTALFLMFLTNAVDYKTKRDKDDSTLSSPYKIRWEDGLLLFLGSVAIAVVFDRLSAGFLENFIFLGAGILLLTGGALDVRFRYCPDMISVGIVCLGAVHLAFGNLPFFDSIVGIFIPGGIILLSSVFMVSLMGGADIKVLMALGVCFGFGFSLMTLIYGCFFVSLCYLPRFLSAKIRGEKPEVCTPLIAGFFMAYLFLHCGTSVVSFFVNFL